MIPHDTVIATVGFIGSLLSFTVAVACTVEAPSVSWPGDITFVKTWVNVPVLASRGHAA